MERDLVISTTFKSVGYDPVARLLELEFLDGPVYQYGEIPQIIYEDFKSADSPGAYFNLRIKDHYPYQRIA